MEWLARLSKAKSLPLLDKEIVGCRKCPRLVEWREEVAVVKRKSYENEKYWGKAIIGLGSFAWDAIFKTLKDLGHPVKKVKFSHGASLKYSHNGREYLLLASYHPRQQNPVTGKLTRPMLESVLKKGGRFASVV